jgi:flagellar protein FliO/FliZ
MMPRWPLISLFFSHALMAADATEKQIGVKVSPLASESLLSIVSGLLLVLALIFAGAWLFKRYGQIAMGGKGLVRVLGGVSVGTRERVIVVEVENTRLLLGVAPGQVRMLHVLNDAEQSFSHHLNAEGERRSSSQNKEEVTQ